MNTSKTRVIIWSLDKIIHKDIVFNNTTTIKTFIFYAIKITNKLFQTF